jgi:hypothetical protein
MNDRLVIRVLAITAVLEFAVIFGGAVGIVAILLKAAPAIAAVAAATIGVASAGVGLTTVTMLHSSDGSKGRQGSSGT